MFGKWFKKEKEKARSLSRPNDLKPGDMVQMIDSFSLPPQLKNQMLTVTEVNTYQYEYENEFEIVLRNSEGDTLFLVVTREDSEEKLAFSIKISRDQVDTLFTLDQFALIFDSEDLVTVETKGAIDGYERWLGKSYIQSADASGGYYLKGDYRNRHIPRHVEDGGERFDYIGLLSPDEEHAINIEIWDDGETDVSLTFLRPMSDIADLFPGQKTD